MAILRDGGADNPTANNDMRSSRDMNPCGTRSHLGHSLSPSVECRMPQVAAGSSGNAVVALVDAMRNVVWIGWIDCVEGEGER